MSLEVENLTQVQEFIHSVAREIVSNFPKIVVFTNGNSWYIDTLIYNLLESAKIHEPGIEFAVFCSDKEGLEKCRLLNFKHYSPINIPSLGIGDSTHNTDSSTTSYTRLSFVKIVLVRTILDLGYIPLYIDPDMAFKTPAIHDLLGYLDSKVSFVTAGCPDYINSNIIIVLPSKETVELFSAKASDVDYIVAHPGLYGDEDFLRPRIMADLSSYPIYHPVPFRTTPKVTYTCVKHENYPNGSCSATPTARMLHANCASGLANKILLLKTHNAWYLPLQAAAISREFIVSDLVQYPPFKEGPLFEEYFYSFIHYFQPFTKRKYIGATWTNLYCNYSFHGQAYDYAKLQLELNELDQADSFYTVVQYDRGVENHTCPKNTLLFGCCEGDIPIPLVYNTSAFQNIKRKSWDSKLIFCSFIGNITHPVREQMIEAIKNSSRFYYYIPPQNDQPDTKLFVEATMTSKFCLAPRGFGRSSFRFFEAFKLGSIPIYIWDDVCWLPFSDVINYSRLCISIHVRELPYLQERLFKITEQQYEAMWDYYEEVKHLFTYEGIARQIIKIVNSY